MWNPVGQDMNTSVPIDLSVELSLKNIKCIDHSRKGYEHFCSIDLSVELSINLMLMETDRTVDEHFGSY